MFSFNMKTRLCYFSARHINHNEFIKSIDYKFENKFCVSGRSGCLPKSYVAKPLILKNNVTIPLTNVCSYDLSNFGPLECTEN